MSLALSDVGVTVAVDIRSRASLTVGILVAQQSRGVVALSRIQAQTAETVERSEINRNPLDGARQASGIGAHWHGHAP